MEQYHIDLLVKIGQLHHLEISTESSEGEQGSTLDIFVTGHDANGNQLTIALADVKVSSSAGEIEFTGDRHVLTLTESGPQHSIRATYGELPTKVVFIDVNPTLFGGIFGSSETVVLLGIGLTITLLLVIAIMFYRKTGKKSNKTSFDNQNDLKKEYMTFQQQTPVPVALTNVPTSLPTPSIQQPVIQQQVITHSSEKLISGTSTTNMESAFEKLSNPSISQEPKLEAMNAESKIESPESQAEMTSTEELEEKTSEADTDTSNTASDTKQKTSEIKLESSDNSGWSDDPFSGWDDNRKPVPDNIEIALDEIIDSSEGPMTKAGVLLKSLPGTNRGDSGWYLGVDGHPFHWEKKE